MLVFVPASNSIELSYDDGARAVELAREVLESYVVQGQRKSPGSMRDAFYNRTGVFVRICSTRGRGKLRGSAGVYQTDEQLGQALVEAVIQAASSAGTHSEIEATELPDLAISVCVVNKSVLTDDPLADLELGTHGVAFDASSSHAWMYPTLPIENDWSKQEYLSRVCKKANVSPVAWQNDEGMITLFEGQVFRERGDGGSVEAL